MQECNLVEDPSCGCNNNGWIVAQEMHVDQCCISGFGNVSALLS